MTAACSACGAKLEFKPGAQAMACPYCGAENRIDFQPAKLEEIPLGDNLFARQKVDEPAPEDVPVIHCSACAADFSLPQDIMSGRCPFCGSTIVMDRRASPVQRPNAVLPFQLESRQAREAYEKWLGSLWFAPDDVKRAAKTDGGFTGIYVPFWTFDAQTESIYTGLRGTRYYTRNAQGQTVTEMQWLPCAGRLTGGFDDVLVPATASLPPLMLAALEPWRDDRLVEYEPRPLAGFATEHATLPLAQGFTWAKQRMEQIIRQNVITDIGGDAQQILTLNIHHDNVTFKTLLLPVWVNAFRYNGRSFRILVNGSTGAVVGDRPYSWLKIAFAPLLAAAAAYALYLYVQAQGQ